jgi:hypothetical protein
MDVDARVKPGRDAIGGGKGEGAEHGKSGPGRTFFHRRARRHPPPGAFHSNPPTGVLTMFRKFLPLNASLFPGQVSDQDNPEDNACPSDVVTVKTGLGRMGLYDVPEEGIDHVPDDKMYRGISILQDLHNMPKTGELSPGDDTHRALAGRLRAQGEGMFFDKPKEWYDNWLGRNGYSRDGDDGAVIEDGGMDGGETRLAQLGKAPHPGYPPLGARDLEFSRKPKTRDPILKPKWPQKPKNAAKAWSEGP